MFIKIFWYTFSLLIIYLVLVNEPMSTNIKSSISQNQLFSVQSNKVIIQRLIAFSIFMFFVLTILRLI
uniref:Preprotein-translocase subunit g n=1 Tax=Pleurostichidium falkenbergii TaxID=121064 RepID=A0A4D6UW80_9FLOR|nr:preprotein-translocase subunit g [Pleurostichidium falkenbergii]QCH39677.1 preprotein-translocase subunit g [Pleurostichidium falkenbergii]